jgi:hypothetical protein
MTDVFTKTIKIPGAPGIWIADLHPRDELIILTSSNSRIQYKYGIRDVDGVVMVKYFNDCVGAWLKCKWAAEVYNEWIMQKELMGHE